jgi:large subunit ribosomal protein L10
LAFTKEQKKDILAKYEELLRKSQAVFLLEYGKVPSKQISALRAKVVESGGELHVTKNTLLRIALNNSGMKADAKFAGTTICGFAFDDIPGVAKIFKESIKDPSIFKIKGGYLAKNTISEKQIIALAELPPLPVVRAQLLGVLNAPASKLVRTLAEPARQVAAVVKAYSEQGQVPA